MATLPAIDNTNNPKPVLTSKLSKLHSMGNLARLAVVHDKGVKNFERHEQTAEQHRLTILTRQKSAKERLNRRLSNKKQAGIEAGQTDHIYEPKNMQVIPVTETTLNIIQRRSGDTLVDVSSSAVDDQKRDKLTDDHKQSHLTKYCSFTRFCCHTHENTDDLILKVERDQLKGFLIDDEPKDTWLAFVVDCIYTGMFFHFPDCSKRRCPKTRSCFMPLQILLVVALSVTLTFWIEDIDVDCTNGCTKGYYLSLMHENGTYIDMKCDHQYYYCPKVQQLLKGCKGSKEEMAQLGLLNPQNYSGVNWRDVYYNETAFPELVGTPQPNAFFFGYLEWKAISRSIIHYYGIMQLPIVILFLIIVYYSLGGKATIRDEIFYPAVLRKSSGGGYKLFRQRRAAHQFAILSVLLVNCLLWLSGSYDNGCNICFITILFTSGPMTALVSQLLLGFIVQIHNATVLGSMLHLVVAAEKSQQRDIDQQFIEWFDIYKKVIGALHAWSTRTSLLIGSLLLILLSEILYGFINILTLYMVIAKDPDIDDKSSVMFYINGSAVSYLLSFTIILLLLLSAMAMISVRYDRLRLLVVTTTIENGKANDAKSYLLDELNLLQRNAAFTLCDVPVRFGGVILTLKVLFVQLGLLLVSMLS